MSWPETITKCKRTIVKKTLNWPELLAFSPAQERKKKSKKELRQPLTHMTKLGWVDGIVSDKALVYSKPFWVKERTGCCHTFLKWSMIKIDVTVTGEQSIITGRVVIIRRSPGICASGLGGMSDKFVRTGTSPISVVFDRHPALSLFLFSITLSLFPSHLSLSLSFTLLSHPFLSFYILLFMRELSRVSF